ncbi:Rieske 2Fe-2S domain-containing protein [Roseomonas sp. GC11]|uniref:Rieske (2Fe-2S) protein n=1 Tax=Roseomonas sp. GC11 TaxID=2950546 RepID=UPI002109B07D|nr:Rieske 2Fe-2S domain-containing protein [Roseomonas sp. GC11]MCQ4159483.1 Rieske 2Fe-2S domain-containing protein [Roseomonas sp. GC11]
MSLRPLCHIGDLPEGGARGFLADSIGQDSIFLLRLEEKVVAYRDSCPHIEGARMAWRRHEYLDAEGRHIVCHGHGALFDPASGLCLKGPCEGAFLSAVPLHITEAGEILVDASHLAEEVP